MKFGDFELTLVNGGDFRLDGGAMHGVVPKAIWSKLVSCDELNRCAYATNCLLVEKNGRRVLVETGNGDKFSPKEKEIFGIDHDGSVEKSLRALGVEPESIDHVIMTHLHFDHSGGTTRKTANGFTPVFSRARHVIQRGEFYDATHPHERNRASYLQDNIGPLAEAGLLELVDGDVEVAPGIRVFRTPGHTAHHQSVMLDDGQGHRVVFFGDVIPTSLHLRLPFIMAFDLDVVATLETKRQLVARAQKEDWLVVFGHERDTKMGRLGLDAKGNAVVTAP
jgi:glyoxylase-like metal-dependent hydrolase (beta-lactamase superfamily II)